MRISSMFKFFEDPEQDLQDFEFHLRNFQKTIFENVGF